MNDITALTPEKLAGIRKRYSPVAAPKCHICGAEMTIGAMSASRIVYACSGATYDDAGCHYAPGRSIADDHYAQSRVTVVDVSDPDVLALVEALEARDKQNVELEQRNNRLSDWGGRIEKLLKSTEESLIYSVDMVRELESRTVTVKLPETRITIAEGLLRKLTYQELHAYNAGAVEAVAKISQTLSAAGIQVIEGEGQ